MQIITVEPPNKGHIGTSCFIHYREVGLFSEAKVDGWNLLSNQKCPRLTWVKCDFLIIFVIDLTKCFQTLYWALFKALLNKSPIPSYMCVLLKPHSHLHKPHPPFPSRLSIPASSSVKCMLPALVTITWHSGGEDKGGAFTQRPTLNRKIIFFKRLH